MNKIAVLALTLSLAGFAKADTAGIDFTNPNNTFTNGMWSLGYAFTPNVNINVTALGVFNDGTMTQSHDVGIYTIGGTLVASSTVVYTGPSTSMFNYVSISPVTLIAGDEYEVVAETGGDPYAYNTIGLTVDPNITYDQDMYVSSPTLSFAGSSSGITAAEGGAWFGGNFLEGTAATPEPSSLMLLGTGFAGLAGVVRRKLKK